MMIKHRERQGLRAGNRKEEAGIHRNYINAVSSVLMIPWTSRPRHEIIIIMITTSLYSVRSSSSQLIQSCSVLSSSDWHDSRVRGDKMLLLQFSKRMKIKRNQVQSCFRFNVFHSVYAEIDLCQTKELLEQRFNSCFFPLVLMKNLHIELTCFPEAGRQ